MRVASLGLRQLRQPYFATFLFVCSAVGGCSSGDVSVASPADSGGNDTLSSENDSSTTGDSSTTSDDSSTTSDDSSTTSNDSATPNDSITSSDGNPPTDSISVDGGRDSIAVDAPADALGDAAICTLAPRSGCCFSNTDCASGQHCYKAECKTDGEGKCKAPPDTGKCWADSDCPPGAICAGAQICACGNACFGPDTQGTCLFTG